MWALIRLVIFGSITPRGLWIKMTGNNTSSGELELNIVKDIRLRRSTRTRPLQ